MIKKTGRRALATAVIGLPVTQTIERALQNVGGGHLVDEHGTALTRGVGGDDGGRHLGKVRTCADRIDGLPSSTLRGKHVDTGCGRSALRLKFGGKGGGGMTGRDRKDFR